MANTILTPTAVTREALAVLHSKLSFIGTINKQYDSSFAVEGAKIGDSLKIRLPNEYTVRSGINMAAQDTTESSTTLQVASVKGVDLNFTSQDLTMSLQDFSARILEPAMSVLASNIEADAMSMLLDIYQNVNNTGSALTLNKVLQGRKVLNDALAPMDGDRVAMLNTQDNLDLVDALKGLFQDGSAIKQQYREGMMGRTAGFDFYENTLIPTQTTGTAAAATTYTVNGAGQTGSGVIVAVGATTFKKGDIVTFVGTNRVHPETKTDTGALQSFVVTADYAGGAGTLLISPAIVTSGGRQNVTASPTNGGAVVKVGAASSVYKPSAVYHKNAFTFATADLVLPKGVDFAAREVMDGISLSMVRQFTIADRSFPTRIDCLYGYKTIRAQLAARLLSN